MTAVGRDERHLRNHPCPVCGGYDETPRGQSKRCSGFTSADGVWCRCSREEYSGSLSPDELGLYRHMMGGGACHCGTEHGSSLTRRPEPEAVYRYEGESGALLFEVVRFPGKQFRQRRPDGAGGWIWKVAGARRVLYRLPELLAADPSRTVYVVEGEKDVETLRRQGELATCNPGGAGKWGLVDSSPLHGRPVTVIADKDEVGRQHARDVASNLRGAVSSVVALECTKGKDVTEHLANGGTLAELVAMAAAGDAPRLRVDRPPRPAIRLVPAPGPDEPPWGDSEPPEPDENPKPEIVMGTDVHRVLSELERHMSTLDDGMFQRGRELVTVLGSDAARGIADGTPVIRPLSQAALLPRITDRVQFVSIKPPAKKAIERAEFEGKRAEPTRCRIVPPSAHVVLPMLARGEWPNVRLLRGITETPVLRPDGQILQTSGYDASTQYLYAPRETYLQVPDSPTQQDAIESLDTLRSIFVDFPFTEDAGSVVAVAAILTVLARPAIEGPVPTFVFEASVRGSGKTLQCDVVHLIATGRSAPHGEWPIDEDEQKKTLNAIALAAPSIVVLDNIKGLFGGSSLEGTLTSERVSFRVLGSKDTADVPWISVVLASGNNVQPTDDMIRRILISRLEPAEEDPTKRDLPDLRAIVTMRRAELVRCALTILRAYCCKGRPDAGCRMASFERWAAIVASAIVFAGGPNVIGARPSEERAATDDVSAAATLIHALPRILRELGGPVTTRALIGALYPAPATHDLNEDVRDAIETIAPLKGIRPDTQLLGKRLRKFVGRWFGNDRLVVLRDAHAKVSKWSVESRSPAVAQP